MRELLMVGTGGFLGAVARYWLSGWVHRWAGSSFPWGTLTVNLLGCALLGALMATLESRLAVTPEARLFLGIGVLGSLTTFSTVGYETVELLRRAAYVAALANAVGSLVLGIAALVVARFCVHWLIG